MKNLAEHSHGPKANNYKHISSYIVLVFFSLFSLQAQEILKGTVYEMNEKNKTVPLEDVNVFWMGTTVGTITNAKGEFSIPMQKESSKLIVRFIGYETDTLTITSNQKKVEILMLQKSQLMKGLVITARMQSSYISKLDPLKTEIITTDGLCRLACCNLAESFENTATVDVGYSDAVSGARQIQMLGLTGLYSQLLLENIPFIRGLSAPFGLGYVPGSFMESIQISKGVASVVNGYETVTGQINLEYRKPQNSDPLFLNLFLNDELKGEINALSAYQFNENLSTMVFAHGSYFNQELDHIGHDHFMDSPKTKQINLVNRWTYTNSRYSNFTLLNYVAERRTGGQMGFDRDHRTNNTADTTQLYGIGIDNQRIQLFSKNGIMLNDHSSTALQISGTYFDQNAFYGLNDYKGKEGNLYANLIYENTFNPKHKLTTGMSFQLNDSRETYTSNNMYSLFDTVMNRNELVPGVFAQYNYTLSDKLIVTAGLRYDYNTAYEQSLVTPRLHVKWSPWQHTSIRVSGGKGYRSAYVLAENFGLMASSRQFVFSQEPLKMEDAWNYGINLVQDFNLGKERNGTFTLDYYRTDFVNQVVVDLDRSAYEVHFYNLDGKSYSNSVQADFTVDVFKGLKATLAGRYNDVQMEMDGKMQEKPYVSKWKALLVLSYATKYDKWIFDLTTQWNGSSRLPNTNGERAEYSNPYFFLLGQITHKFKHIDVYAGCENITNYVQKDPIIGAHHPFSQKFDASVTYAPMMGRLFYVGLRWSIK